MTFYMHRKAGKIRICTSALKKNEVGAFLLSKTLKLVPGIHSTEISQLSGIIIILYDPKIVSSLSILRILADYVLNNEIIWGNSSLRTDPFVLRQKQMGSSKK